MKNTVWIVYHLTGEMNEKYVDSVFSTKELAQKYIDTSYNSWLDSTPEEFELN